MPKTKKLKLSTYQRKKGSVVKTEVNAPKDKSLYFTLLLTLFIEETH